MATGTATIIGVNGASSTAIVNTETNTEDISTAIGAKADTVATTDTGTFSLIALFKRLLGKLNGFTEVANVSETRRVSGRLGDLTSPIISVDAGQHAEVFAYVASLVSDENTKVRFYIMDGQNQVEVLRFSLGNELGKIQSNSSLSATPYLFVVPAENTLSYELLAGSDVISFSMYYFYRVP